MVSVQHGREDFYPRSPCGERHRSAIENQYSAEISIHALLAESDSYSQHVTWPSGYFYPRSPCGERLGVSGQSHLPIFYFYPRSPCGERRGHNSLPPFAILFLSTLSLRRATTMPDLCQRYVGISIHALLAESDRIGGATNGSI